MVRNSMETVSFYDPKSEAEAKRKRALAEMLMAQGQPTGTEKVGRYVVPKSGLEQFAKLGSNLYGQYLGAQADNQQAEMLSGRQKAIGEALGKGGKEGTNEFISILAQNPETLNSAVDLYGKTGKANGGINSAGFEGDIARSLYTLSDPNASEESRRQAQAVVNTAERFKGSWDPITGNWALNQGSRLGGMVPQSSMGQALLNQSQQMQPSQGQGMPMQQPTMQAPQGGLLPPPNMGGGQPDMSMFQGQMQHQQPQMQMPSTGNRKLDAEMAQAQAAQNMRVAAEKQIAEQTAMRERQSTLPQTLETAQNNLSVIDQALSNPGLSSSVGGTFGMQGRQAQAFPITQAQRDFQPLATQLQGQSFLQAFQSLKGGGAITEVEGQKATQAIARLQQSQSEESYRNALNELRDIVSRGIERAQSGAMQTPQQQALGAVGAIGSTTPTTPQQSNPYSGMSDDQLRQRLMGGAR